MSPLIELQDICVEFDQRRVLDNVSLSIARGKITTLIGPNGAGKSTLVRVLLGLHSQDSGTITRAKNLKIGYVPQKLKLNDTLPLTVNVFCSLPANTASRNLTMPYVWLVLNICSTSTCTSYRVVKTNAF